ncbi:3-hydroxyisobutyryl-CoA hydrolase [Friedmanniomyces endolithicus]|nr:3-hydroxyisobutyryl-CoA hydrolase [Friedmanniomyces endolithicus]KAK0288235.1 3-hydroxyisobutyryl-CoA hydrolase [Friedmanniomyces endolithicus]KAK0289862.1 3-hydroxyisobutyryl-CoA hydrolase [Friedmanniomyces endolithicus]KAK0308385.1 3-hydroxyisobutyryl-CoA hydrolase [Friedmanniomyces endolithicus]KAK0326167.1 3-hydroxyisobutyryl-CoA hydrolase [Friedmanniomyces endolithicus]
MPLRAKILNPAIAGNTSRSFASSIHVTEQPGDEANDVLFNSHYGLRTITLNRPKKLNSLNGSMARKIIPRLQEWSKSQLANVVVIKGEGRAFCAGGDVAALATQNKQGAEGQQNSKDYFALEYKLDHLIATYSKPYVAFIDGITMGGGVGLSLHAPFRIATENTVMAMPETTIGFFPDVGASFFLPRMDGDVGMYLALTSEQLKGVDVFWAGIATHYLHSSSLPDLEARLAELQFKDYDTMQQRLQIIDKTIEEFSTGVPHDRHSSNSVVGGNLRAAVDYVFQPANSITMMLDALQGLVEGSTTPLHVQEWASKTRKTMLQRSPTSVKVAVKQLREGIRWGIAETFRKEFTIASHFMEHPDFVEGVSALLINKPKTTPKWSPSTLEEVTEKTVMEFFVGEEEAELELLPAASGEGSRSYTDYPHAWVGLPREREVREFVLGRNGVDSVEEVVKHFVNLRDGKQGVKEKVEEILARKGELSGNRLGWKR